MIDAGSTGSRIHIYKFHNCLAQPTYEYEVYRHTKPGLSHYAGSPNSAAESLDQLMMDALEVVPAQLRSCTPVAVKATAGLRLLGTKESSEILQAVQARLTSRYPFAMNKDDGVVILDGKDEGVFAWITVNYLIHTFGPLLPNRRNTYAVLDLGGASTQIVFEPRSAGSPSKLMEGDHKYTLEFGGSNHTLYQHSFLGYGLKEARRSIHRLTQFMSKFNKEPQHTTLSEIANPCLSRGTSKTVDLEDGPVMMTGADVGSFEGCRRVVELVMAKDA
jgi:guanosine-diphosphatase